MKCFIAKHGSMIFTGSWYACTNWAIQQVSKEDTCIIKIYQARGGEKNARIVSEVSNNTISHIANGRYMSLKDLWRA